MSSKIAFIGLGNMGGAMVRHLIHAGHTLSLHARRADAMEPFVALGARACNSAAEAAVGADFICTNVTATADVEAVLLGTEGAKNGAIHGAKPGAIVCDFSTIDVSATRRVAAALAKENVEYLDCPVSGGTRAAIAASLTIMVGGKAEVLAKAKPLLEKLGMNIFHMGDVGCGQVTKACNQTVQVINIQGIAEAMLFARENGVDGNKVVEALMSGFAGSKMLGLMGPKMANRDFAAGIEARLHHKDFGLIADMADKQDLAMPATHLVYEQLNKLMLNGWGTMDTCNLLRVLEEEKVNLYKLLQQRVADGHPVRVGLIGAGKFGSMYLSQIPRTPGIHLLGVADLDPQRAGQSLRRVGWKEEQFAAENFKQAFASGTTHLTDDAMALIRNRHIEVIIDATGSPAAGIAHVLACCEHRKHIVMVNVEADALAGPLLARRAEEAGIVYSLAYGDQPALICEMVDWARAAGFEVVAAGKGTKYLPAYHSSTPETVWGHYGFSEETVSGGDFNAQMFNSFLDGTKSAIEMAAVANATGLTPSPRGLEFPPCGVDDLARVLKPKADGGQLHHRGQVEVISSVERDGRPVFRDLRWGVYVTFAADTDYVRKCFNEYRLITDDTGNYSSMYKPFHLIGLELGISVASAAVRGEATGAATGWRGDCVATAKRDLKAGELLDGEGGFTVYGKLLPAAVSKRLGGLPMGLAHKVKLTRNIAAGKQVTWEDVAIDMKSEAVRFRREMEKVFA